VTRRNHYTHIKTQEQHNEDDRVDEELVVGIFHHPDLQHPSDGGGEEEWAESQQGHSVVVSSHIPGSRPRVPSPIKPPVSAVQQQAGPAVQPGAVRPGEAVQAEPAGARDAGRQEAAGPGEARLPAQLAGGGERKQRSLRFTIATLLKATVCQSESRENSTSPTR